MLPRGSATRVPTVPADPKYRLTLTLVDETDDKLPFTGDVLYKHLCAGVAYQIKNHTPVPFVLDAAVVTQWFEKFFAMFTYLEVNSVEAWGNPYVAADRASSTKFKLALLPTNTGVSPAPPAMIDSAAGSSERPYARRMGGKLFFASQSTTTQRVLALASTDVCQVHVTVW